MSAGARRESTSWQRGGYIMHAIAKRTLLMCMDYGRQWDRHLEPDKFSSCEGYHWIHLSMHKRKSTI